MKDLKIILKESIFDDDMDIYSGIKDEIKRFIEYNYDYNKGFVISDSPNKNGLYEVSGLHNITLMNNDITSLINNLFEWIDVNGDFICVWSKRLKSLKGAPKKVGGYFGCVFCNNLKSLEGAPEEISGDFNCSFCKNLKSLECAPKKSWW